MAAPQVSPALGCSADENCRSETEVVVAQRVALKGACLIRHQIHHYLKLQARILRSEVGVSFDWPSKHFVIKVYADVSD